MDLPSNARIILSLRPRTLMGKTLIVLFTLLISFSVNGQVKTIRGIIYDYYTRSHIGDVEISPAFYDSIVFSKENGKFRLSLPSDYKDTLNFSHPDYYPLIKRIKGGDKMKLHFITLVPRSLQIDTICYSAFKENKLLKGKIYDKYRSEPLDSATIRLENKQIIAYSDKSGDFAVGVPLSSEKLIVSHPDFQTNIVPIKFRKWNNRETIVKLDRINFHREDSLWKVYKNMLAFAPQELITGAVGLRYERFIKIKHAVGLHTSVYLHGRGYGLFSSGISKFTGIKLAPFYRYYVWRNMNNSGFIEGKLVSGYFDCHELYYAMKYDDRRGEFASEQFWSFGIGVAWGWSIILPRTKHGIFNISAGLQAFPMHVPNTIQGVHYGTLEVENNWWYLFGPGSVVEVKIAFGGIF